MYAASVIVMSKSVINSFTNAVYLERISFDTDIVLIGDLGFKILCIYEVNYLISNSEQRTFKLILIL